jgi:hypothetical protein
MYHWVTAGLSMLLFSGAAAAEEIASVYTDLDPARDCTTFAAGQEGDGDYANMACNGYGGYPVLIFSGDLRESIYYGFPRPGDLAPAWESFSAFNSAGPKIEWRISKDGDRTIPFATIHRWFVSEDPDEPDRKTEVLVVEKVGQINGEEGCAVGLVVATGNPGANETARGIADGQARDFACGDERVLVGEPMPSFERQAN